MARLGVTQATGYAYILTVNLGLLRLPPIVTLRPPSIESSVNITGSAGFTVL